VSSDRASLDDFSKRRGRRPRVLHVGNIGNNAYLNARFLRQAGVECHVIAADYYDRLATPEWEGHGRPPWFVQGPLALSAAYLSALADGDRSTERRLRLRLRASRSIPPNVRLLVRRARFRAAAIRHASPGRAAIDSPTVGSPQEETDLAPYLAALPTWTSLFGRYDIVQAYATDPIWPYASGQQPYVAYEHGTLREFTSDRDALSRLTTRAYRGSAHTFVTNGDCLPHARRIGIPSFSAMIHPIDVAAHREDGSARSTRLRRELNADTLLFCPMRHDWTVKGTDVHIRALPKLLSLLPGRTVLALCDWGVDVAKSRRLVDELGCGSNVAWLPLMPRRDLIAAFKAADVVLDQMTLPHFDATVPQALAAGVPVIMSYRSESTEWIVDEPAPILSAFDVDEVIDAVEVALEPTWRADFAERARSWIDREHHPRRLVAEHLRVYRDVLEATGGMGSSPSRQRDAP
jgi:glycosyltransferase involved in cell wall biosynthesis